MGTRLPRREGSATRDPTSVREDIRDRSISAAQLDRNLACEGMTSLLQSVLGMGNVASAKTDVGMFGEWVARGVGRLGREI